MIRIPKILEYFEYKYRNKNYNLLDIEKLNSSKVRLICLEICNPCLENVS